MTNEILYPEQLDTISNLPDLEVVTADSFVEINAYKEAIVTIERILGINPQIGIFTEDPSTSTVSQRISILEEGMSSGRYRMNEINVANALIVRHENGVTDSFIGRNSTDTDGYGTAFGNVKTTVRGTMEVLDVSTFRGSILVSTDKNKITAATKLSNLGKRIVDPYTGIFDYSTINTLAVQNNSIVTIQDTNLDYSKDRNLGPTDSLQHTALWVVGNVQIDGILRAQELSLDHSALKNIDTTPVVTNASDAQSAINKYVHVKWGDWHSHIKKAGSYDRTSTSPHWTTEPMAHNYGVIDHKDLVGIHTNNQIEDTVDVVGFIPKAGVAYHVTGGNDHDHNPAGAMGGGTIDHRFLDNAGSETGHVTSGDLHNHTNGGGLAISHYDLIFRGTYSHTEIDAYIKTGNQEAQYLNQLLGGAQIDTYDSGKISRRQIYKDSGTATAAPINLLEDHSFSYDTVNTSFIKTITRTIYDKNFPSSKATVTYSMLNDGINYTRITWTPAL